MAEILQKIIAVSNQKGGVGKTTTSVNLAASLYAAKKKVLLVDLDPQGNATTGCGIDRQTLQYTINDVLLGSCSVVQARQTVAAGFQVLPANSDLTVAEVTLLNQSHRELRLRQVLQEAQTSYEFIIIDCPPSLNILTVNALSAADSVLIPMQCEYYALEGLAALMATIQQIQQSVNPALHIEGLLRTMYDGRSRLAAEVSQQLYEHFPDKVYRTVIPRNIRLAEAPSHGLPALQYDKRSQGASAYLVLAGEIIRKQQRHPIDGAVIA